MCDNKSTNIKIRQDSFSRFLLGSQFLTPSVPPRHTGSFLHSMLLVRTYRACVISEGRWVAYVTQRWLRLKKKKKVSAAYSPKIKLLYIALDVFVWRILSGSLTLWFYSHWVCICNVETFLDLPQVSMSGLLPWSLLNEFLWVNKRKPYRVFPHINNCVLKTLFFFSKYKPLKCNHMIFF